MYVRLGKTEMGKTVLELMFSMGNAKLRSSNYYGVAGAVAGAAAAIETIAVTRGAGRG